MVSVQRNAVDMLLVGALLAAAVATLRVRSQKHRRSAQLKNSSSDARELELVKDIVYINNTVGPDQFRLNRRNQTLNDEGNQILVVGVCGGSGSGKTTLSKAIISDFGADRVSYLSHDYYYKDLSHLTMEQRAEHNFDHPDSLETDLLIEHLRKLRAGKEVEVPKYDFSTHSRCKQTSLMKPNSVILVEGILIFADPELASLMDIKIFVETSADIRLVRRLRRDMEERQRTAESVMNQYMKTVRPMHMMFVEQSKRVADIIIPHGVNSVALDMIISRLHSFTSNASSGSERSDSLGDEKELLDDVKEVAGAGAATGDAPAANKA
uniref:Uridine kinase n=1 Tax=Globisporangium ultimum (strain ATCC 200006 / CBS 805.95 / DAOM BR144) TaxID=431595 RepID=K3WYZ5_GLOUD